MRRFLRAFALGLLIGGLAGLWLGINIGRDQPLLSNPLATAAATLTDSHPAAAVLVAASLPGPSTAV